MARLRSDCGCPWDRKQTFESLRSFLVEEAYEVLEAIDRKDPASQREELGDVLFQIIFQCQIAAEKGLFDLSEVIDGIARKINRRHPHVFGTETARTAAEVVTTWERIKKEEKDGASRQDESVLSGLPTALPALLAAHRISERAARVGFDWENPEQVLDKLGEELAELREALKPQGGCETLEPINHELGDLLFAVANLARHLGFYAEDSLRTANRRFSTRFRVVEKLAKQQGIDLASADIQTLEMLWQEAKASLADL